MRLIIKFTTVLLLIITNCLLLQVPGFAQLSINTTGTPYTINFDASVDGVNNGQYLGTGFIPAPEAGQLNSNAWASTGMTDGNSDFGGTYITGDFAVGNSPGGVTGGGFYSFTVATGNNVFGVQPTGNDWTPGTIILKIKNNTGSTVGTFNIAYNIWLFNDQPRSNSFNFSYSNDNVQYTQVTSLDYISPGAATGTTWESIPKSITLDNLGIANGDFFYIRWNSDDVSGSGSRDEFGIDDIVISAGGGTVLPEPTNYPTQFSASSLGLDIKLYWIDATGGQLPTGYLIKASTSTDITAPVDGTPEPDDLNLSDGSGVKNISPGIQTFTFPNLAQNTPYYFKIFPYTNSGSNINFKTSGTPPSATTTTPLSVNYEDFNTGTFGTWTQYSVTGDQVWLIDNTFGIGGTPCAKMSGYSGAPVDNEDWLISPALDLDLFEGEVLSFYSAMNFTGPALTVQVAADYTGGDPNTASWTDVSDELIFSQGGYQWTFSSYYDMTWPTGSNIRIAFKYLSDASGASTWELDNISISGFYSGANPVLNVIAPATGAQWQQGTNQNVLWSAINTSPNVKIEVSANASSGNPTWTQIGNALANAGNWNWNIPSDQPIGNDYKIRLTDFTSDLTAYSGLFSIVPPPVIADLVITEIMYNPPEAGTDSLEFIEIYNNDIISVDLNNYKLATAVDFTFPQITLNPGQYQLIAYNATAIQNTFGKTALQWTTGSLNNAGETIELKDSYGNLIDMVPFLDVLPWDTAADGDGPSLTLCDPNLDNSLPESWTHSVEFAAINAAGDTIWATPGTGCIVLPVADFSANTTSIQVGSGVTFTDLSSGSPTTWSWTFEGGTPGTYNGQTPPTIVYNTAGTYDVTLTVSNQYGSDTETKANYITVTTAPPPPGVNFTGNPTTINQGQSVQFTDQSTNTPTSWAWTFPGGTPGSSTLQNPSVIYNTPGVYDVTLAATNQYGSNSLTKAAYITVNAIPPPTPNFTANVTNIPAGGSVNFTDQSTGNPTSWSWSFPGGSPATSSQQNPSGIIYNTPGTYDVSLTVSNQYGSNSLTKTDYITVFDPNTAQIVITEIMYNPPETGDDSLEYIEIYNNGSAAANLNGWTFSQGVVFTFPSYNLNPGSFAVIAKNSAAIQNTFGVESLQWTEGSLSNSGEILEIKDAQSNVIDFVQFLDITPWPTEPDGSGPSLVLCNPNLDNNIGENWFASLEFITNNGAGQPIYGTPGGICTVTEVNEVMDGSEFVVYPNPSLGSFSILSDRSGFIKIEVRNLIGQSIYSDSDYTPNSKVDSGILEKGLYLIYIFTENSNNPVIKKLIIQ